jgi:5S rRNA maturation endonuclease (ribonuclease M5)
MGPEANREYVEAVRERYERSNRKGKKRILDEMCLVIACHRKAAIRMLNGLRKKKARRPGPKPQYGEAEVKVLRAIWLGAEQPCGKRMVAAICLWLPWYERQEKLKKEVREKLLKVSAATVDRLLKPVRARLRVKGLGGTKPGSLLKTQIPIRGESWDEKRPGYMEADTVAHCGGSLAGDFVWSLTFTDIATGWTENAAVWNKGASGVKERIREMEKELPFKLLGFDCDNGGEFLNHHLWSYLRERDNPVDFTRSRPYRKNDQAHVEQKNWTHVRQLLGYDRLERSEIIEPMSELYRLWGLLHNYFCPTLKLKEKIREGAKVRRSYEKPRTPCQRLLEMEMVDTKAKLRLKKQFRELDPFDLKRQIEAQLRRVFELKKRLQEVQESTISVSENRQPAHVAFGNTLP